MRDPQTTRNRRKYTFELVVYEGCDEFWESIKGKGKKEVTEEIKSCLAGHGFFIGKGEDTQLALKGFEYV